MVKSLPFRRWELLGYTPNEWALTHIHGREERFVTAVTTRQCGKTWCAAIEIDEGMTAPADGVGPPWVGLIAPSYQHCDLVVKRYLQWIDSSFGKSAYAINQNKHQMTILDPKAGTPGAVLQWVSADDPMYSMGFSFSKLLFDESQRVSDEVFFKARPTANAREAPIRCFGTPDITMDQSWFRGMYLRGLDEEESNYHSHTVTCYENPHISAEEILEAQKVMSEREFRMLYLAEWVSDEGAFFKNINNAIIPKAEYNPRTRNVMSVDFAVHEDYNAVMVGESSTRTVFYHDRWNYTDPYVTYDKIEGIWEKFGKPRVVADATGMGETMWRELRERGMSVIPVKFGAYGGTMTVDKIKVLSQLAADIEHRRIMFPDWADLKRELQGFIFQRTPSGRITAGAAAGYHDDLVTALALLNEGFRSRGRGSASQYSYLGEDDPSKPQLRQLLGI